MGELGTVLPAGGVAVTLAMVIGYLLRSNAVDRRDYQDAVDRINKRADEMEARLNVAQSALDGERQARRHIEDLNAVNMRALEQLRSVVGLGKGAKGHDDGGV